MEQHISIFPAAAGLMLFLLHLRFLCSSLLCYFGLFATLCPFSLSFFLRVNYFRVQTVMEHYSNLNYMENFKFFKQRRSFAYLHTNIYMFKCIVSKYAIRNCSTTYTMIWKVHLHTVEGKQTPFSDIIFRH